MSNLTDLLPAGAGGKQVSFVASGTIGNGVTVALKTDGTVEAISGVAQGFGSQVAFTTVAITTTSATFDSANNKIVIAYQGSAGYGTAVVGTVSGTSISFGTPVVFNSANSFYVPSAFDSSSNKVVIAYRNTGNSSYGTAIVGTVSGTTISFGAAVVFESAATIYPSVAFDSNSNKIVIGYRDGGNSDYGTAIVGTVSGTSISFGSPVVFSSGSTNYISTIFNSSANKIVIAYQNASNSSYGTAIVGTVSGTSISFGSATVFQTEITPSIRGVFDPNSNKVVIVYANNGNLGDGTAIVGTVSGTSISFGTAVAFRPDGPASYMTPVFDSSANKIIISYDDLGNSGYGTLVVGTVSGTSISFETPVVFNAAESEFMYSVYDPNSNKTIMSYRDTSLLSYGYAIVFEIGNTNSANFIGITDAAISNAASGSVTIKGGISTNVTGLTPNQNYYVQADGTLSTTTSSVLAGKALSSTSINLDYTT